MKMNYQDLRATFGGKLRYWRLKRGLRQWQLAYKAGLETRRVMCYEKGHDMPSLESFAKLLRALGMTYDEFMGGVE